MISPSLHPAPVSAVCERRRRWSFGLTPRTIGLLLAGFVWLIPGFWDGRLAYTMLAWDALVLLFVLLDGLRLPAAAQLTAGRSWLNAPALDSETEIELTIENHGRMILDCRIVDDLPDLRPHLRAVRSITVEYAAAEDEDSTGLTDVVRPVYQIGRASCRER